MKAFFIVCPLVFLAGLVDSIGGGGGLISLPAYLLAGLPVHTAIATNKLSSSIGTSVSTGRFIRHGYVHFKFAGPCLLFSIAGSILGSNLSLRASDRILRNFLMVVLPVAAFFVLFNRKKEIPEGGTAITGKMYAIGFISALLIGIYDGFYGPGTGTFLLLAFTGLAKTDLHTAAGTTKVLNLTSNITALFTFLVHREVLFPLGLAAAVFCMAGHYIGAGLVDKNGMKVIRPIILTVLALLFIKILTE